MEFLSFFIAIFWGNWVSRHQNVTILDFIGAKADLELQDVQNSSQIDATNKPSSYGPDVFHVAQPTVSKQWREISMEFSNS